MIERFEPQAELERATFTPRELEQIGFMRANGIMLDPDGFDTIDEIRAALGKTHSGEF